jgi:hypothetical protein
VRSRVCRGSDNGTRGEGGIGEVERLLIEAQFEVVK